LGRPYNERQQPWHDFITHTPTPCLQLVDFWVAAARAPPDISPSWGELGESEGSSGARTIRTTASTEAAIAMSVQCTQAIYVLYTQTDFHAKIYQPNQHPESLASVLRKCFLISFCPALVKREA